MSNFWIKSDSKLNKLDYNWIKHFYQKLWIQRIVRLVQRIKSSNWIKSDQSGSNKFTQSKKNLAPMCSGCMVGMAKARNTQFFAAKIACAFESTRKQQNFALCFGCSFLLPLALLAVRPKLPILTVLSSQSHYTFIIKSRSETFSWNRI